ncbi:hypothetical protein EJ06DRAFT_584576 [Trichodelitschia bisporula]|uniref:Uncharacterized protein n=1 Tax=Trichodelitschia bisporula TaxID=703511 RepID=A0A6G1HMI8_9PEZI|nr:hypothetical protein EJ06DRAFT_584576 [Trichodelitschia bisporula]
MFCLRSWIPILFFLTNASPIYLLLFISATYTLNRPCVYCSLLLGILVLALFDFQASWFEPRYALTGVGVGSSARAAAGANDTGGSIGNSIANVTGNVTAAAIGEVVRGVAGAVMPQAVGGWRRAGRESLIVEWVRSGLRREWRIGCLDVAVRL